MDKHSPIAVGRTAEVFAWGEHQALKLFRPEFAAGVAAEERVARLVALLGVGAPAVLGAVRHQGRPGLIYEFIAGCSLVEVLLAAPERLEEIARRLADVHADVHRRSAPRLPRLCERLTERIAHAPDLPDNLRKAALKTLAELPDGSALCHGDFHPANILENAADWRVVDWTDATRGDPAADVARTTLLLTCPPLPDGLEHLQRLRFHFCAVYQSCYFTHHPERKDAVNTRLPVVAAARLCEDVADAEREELICLLRKTLT